ncbi:MAG TPA: LysR substrate-binding domain-containing protein [Pseudolabrys sp.]|nr:LysR substrate-binding domain-containing protein [Pseudolabrys sp.]
MDLRSLRYFVSAAKLNSISKAANQLHVAQPALGRQIRKLEKDLGVELLGRDSRGVQLTEAGARLLDKGESILRQIEQATAEVRSCGKDPQGSVSVAIMPSVAALFAPQLVTRVRERYPAVKLQISEGLTTFIVGGLLGKKFDLGLIPARPVDPALSTIPLLTEPMFLIGPGREFADGDARSPVTLKQLGRFPLLLPSRGNTLREQIETVAKRNKIQLDVRENVDSSAVIKHLVLSGLGYTIQCYSFVHEETERGELQVRPLRIPGLSRQWALARLREQPESFVSVVTARVMLEIASELSRRTGWSAPERSAK